MSKKCHICGKEVKENYYLDERGYTCYTCSRAIASKRSIMKNTKEVFKMTAKRFYYNTFYHRDNMSRVLEYEIIDRQSYPNYPYHNEKEDIPQWYIYIGENDSGWQDMLVDLLNEQHETIQRLKQNIDELLSVNVEEELLKENKRLKHKIKDIVITDARDYNKLYEKNEKLKSFIKELTSNDGKIWLMNGYVYKTDKILKGDVE